MPRIYSPSPTVASSRVPLYLQGFPSPAMLGQDDSFSEDYFLDTGEYFDFTPPAPVIPDYHPMLPMPVAPDIGTGIQTLTYDPMILTNPTLKPLLDQGFTAQEAQMINSAAASGHITNDQFQSILSGNHSFDQIKNTIFGAANTAAAQVAALKAASAAAAAKLPPGPAPRVATPTPGSAASLLTQQSIPGVPNWALLAAGAVALVAMGKR